MDNGKPSSSTGSPALQIVFHQGALAAGATAVSTAAFSACSEAVEKAGAPKIRLHDTRHTMATLALEAGVHPKVVQEQLGHSAIAVTLDTYSQVPQAVRRDSADKIAGLYGA